jgi:hypothetical protein
LVLNAAFAFGMTFLRGCYHQILEPRRHLPKFSVDRMLPYLRLSDELIGLMKDDSLSSAQAIDGALGTRLRPSTSSTSVTDDGEISLSDAYKQGVDVPAPTR